MSVHSKRLREHINLNVHSEQEGYAVPGAPVEWLFWATVPVYKVNVIIQPAVAQVDWRSNEATLLIFRVDGARVEEFHLQSSSPIDSLQNQRKNELNINRTVLTKK